MQSEGEGGVGLDVSVCLRSVAVAAVLTVAHAKHAKDFVAGSLPSSSAGSLTPIKHRPRETPAVSSSAAEESTNSYFTDGTSSFSLLNPPLPSPLTAACAKQLLAYRKDLRYLNPKPLCFLRCGPALTDARPFQDRRHRKRVQMRGSPASINRIEQHFSHIGTHRRPAHCNVMKRFT